MSEAPAPRAAQRLAALSFASWAARSPGAARAGLPYYRFGPATGAAERRGRRSLRTGHDRVGLEYREPSDAGVSPARAPALVFARSAHVARRRRIGPSLLRALTEGREAASKHQSGHDRVDTGTAAPGRSVKQQPRPAAFRGSIRRTAVLLADDRFDRGDASRVACASATSESRRSRRPGAGRMIAFAAPDRRTRRRARLRNATVPIVAPAPRWP